MSSDTQTACPEPDPADVRTETLSLRIELQLRGLLTQFCG
jgi:hypothetical protein